MKKNLFFLVMALFCINIVNASEKVPVYIITKDGCVNCENAIAYFKGLDNKDKTLFSVTVFDVFDEDWQFKSSELKTFYKNLMISLNEEETDIATPVIVIGDYHNIGLPKDREELITAIKNYQKENQKDPVKQILKEMNITTKELKNSTKKSNDGNGIVLLTIFGVIVLGFVCLLIFPKK